jgi:hypothetical protein
MALRSWGTRESGGVVCCRVELTEKGRYNFKKINIQNFTDPTDDVVGKTNVKEYDVAIGGET